MCDHCHITKDRMRSGLSEAELAHIAVCDSCADLFAGYMEEQPLIRAPRGLRDSVMQRSRQIDVRIAAKTNQTSGLIQMLCYSLKVGTAVLGALALLIATPSSLTSFRSLPVPGRAAAARQLQPPSNRLYEKASEFTAGLNHLPYIINQMEVTQHDKKEK